MKTSGIEEYWKYLDSLDKDVRDIVLKYWDDTGRATGEHPVIQSIGELLDCTNTFDEFFDKYKQFYSGDLDWRGEYKDLETQAREYYHIYIVGMKRVSRAIDEEFDGDKEG